MREEVEREKPSGVSLYCKQVLNLAFAFPSGQSKNGCVGFHSTAIVGLEGPRTKQGLRYETTLQITRPLLKWSENDNY